MSQDVDFAPNMIGETVTEKVQRVLADCHCDLALGRVREQEAQAMVESRHGGKSRKAWEA